MDRDRLFKTVIHMKERYKGTMLKWSPIQVIEKRNIFYVIYSESSIVGMNFHVHQYSSSFSSDWNNVHLTTLHWARTGDDALKWLIGELTLNQILDGIPIDIVDIYAFSSLN